MHSLHYGKSKKPLAWVMPDDRYPTMWRIHWPDGSVSDMVNLTRACDAAIVLAVRRSPQLNHRLLRWKQKAPESAAEARHSAFDAAPLSN